MQQRNLFSNKLTAKPRETGSKQLNVITPPNSKKRERQPDRCYDPIYCKIKQRRWQMLIHSCIYYELNSSIITDFQFDTWARELVSLQNNYPEVSQMVPWYEYFKSWDGTTGFDLPTRHPDVLTRAQRLLQYTGGKRNGQKTD